MNDNHPPMAGKVVCIDYDGTLFPWGNLMNWDAKPIPGAQKVMRALHDAGYLIYIFTSRLSDKWLDGEGHDPTEQITYLTWMLSKHGIPWDYLTSEKVPAVAYVDDKAIEFTGNNWPEIGERLLNGFAAT